MTHPVYIEYHINVFSHGTWSVMSESHPVGTSFHRIIFDSYSGFEKAVLLHLRWSSYGWPGGYEIHYSTADCGVLCHKCANDNLDQTLGDDAQWKIVAADINYEDADLFCDHCNTQIEPAYGLEKETT